MDIGDVTLVAYMVVGKVPVDLSAYFNNNGRIDIGDVAKIAYYLVRDMVCEKVLFVGKTRSQISHHRKDGVTEAWIESIVMHTPDTKRKYLKNGSFVIEVRRKKPSGAILKVFIYVREEVFKIEDKIIWREKLYPC